MKNILIIGLMLAVAYLSILVIQSRRIESARFFKAGFESGFSTCQEQF